MDKIKPSLYLIGGIIIGVVLALFIWSISLNSDEHSMVLPLAPTPVAIIVDVKGAVSQPGVYNLPRGSRAYDAISAAGGLLTNADESRLNLAARLEDGQVLYVPYVGEDIQTAIPTLDDLFTPTQHSGFTPYPPQILETPSATSQALTSPIFTPIPEHTVTPTLTYTSTPSSAQPNAYDPEIYLTREFYRVLSSFISNIGPMILMGVGVLVAYFVTTKKLRKSLKKTTDKELPTPKKLRHFRISIAHPKFLSKRFESSFLFQVYTPDDRIRVTKNITDEFNQQEMAEHIQESSIGFGQLITVKFFSPEFVFSEPVTKLVTNKVSKIVYLGKPKDDCTPGLHRILVSVLDTKTNHEFESLTVSVQVVDFAFDHISRPMLSRVSAVVLGISSFAMYILTFLEQIDKTVGLTSGTAAGVLALGIYVSFYNLYQRVRPNTP